MTSANRERRSAGPAFGLFGFPVTVRPGFLAFVAIAIIVNPGPIGFWLAGSIAVLTVVHELGHAFAARRAGAHSEIALDMLAGYTTYSSPRPLSPGQKALIAVSGPAAEIVVGVLLLLVMGANPLSHASIEQSDARIAIWWAGPILGLFNLVPLFPLDGGTIVGSALEKALPGRGQRLMVMLSLPLTAAATVMLLASDRLRPLAAFTGLLLVMQIGQVAAQRRSGRRQMAAAAPSAEAVRVATLLVHGDAGGAAVLGAQVFSHDRDPDIAILVARAAARLGETQTAMAWLQSAADAGDPLAAVVALDTEPDLAIIRADPAAGALRVALGAG